MIKKPLNPTEKDVAICIGRAVAPYVFRRDGKTDFQQFFHNDREYADNVPFTDIEHEARTIVKNLIPKKWLIWSHEHKAWWNPGWRGYTNSREAAGRYSFNEARKIVREANCRNGDMPNEAMVEDVDDDQIAKKLGRV